MRETKKAFASMYTYQTSESGQLKLVMTNEVRLVYKKNKKEAAKALQVPVSAIYKY